MKESQKIDAQQVENLVNKAKAGDAASFGIIFDHFIDEIFRFSFLKVGNREDAQDIASETFTRAWSYLSRYKSDNFRAYLYAIARNLCYDSHKNHTRKAKILTEHNPLDISTDINDSIIDEEQSEWLIQAIKKLPDNYQDIIILRFINGLSIKETAKAVGKSGGSVRTAQHRALQKLKKLLKP